jgi:tRNA nucleotidyltransferase (CCA-adding enzyme)
MREMKLMIKNVPIVIPDDVTYTIETLENDGFEAFIVGGCVRDSILGRTPKDWDITTNALPLDVLNIFKNLGFNVIETGLKHGTVTVMINHVGYEITTYRIDGEYEDSRHPSEVKFVTDIKKDLARRDFTINAMAYNFEKGLVDPFNGLEDLNNKVINCVGNSIARFNEDALRMLRAVRFSAQLGFYIDKTVILGICRTYENLKNISMERIREELNKILLSDSNRIYDLISFYLIDCFIPEIKTLEDFEQNNPYHNLNLLDHTLKSVQLIENELHLKLAMLFHDFGKVKTQTTDENGISHYYEHPSVSVEIASMILDRMKYDNDTKDKVLMLIGYHDCNLDSRKAIKRALNKMGEDLLIDLIKVKWADILAQNPVYAKERLIKLVETENILNEIINQKECFSVKDLAINGKDLIKLGYRQGREIGYTLNELLKMVMEDNNLNTKEKLIEIVKKEL